MLAIVIPAYKPQFFQLALNSVKEQTNKNFKCYIFDDAAPEEIRVISDKFPNFHYTRFNENMGGCDLVGHWHRCLEFVEEEWVWLFSDDDIMAPNCIDEFYKALNLYPNSAVFRFAIEVIDADGQVTRINKQPIKNETGLEFLGSRLSGTISAMPDHIFNWKKLKEINGGIVNFPLATASDDATWCLLGKTNEIIAINFAVVQWRNSNINISSINNAKTLKTKFYAHKLFYLWCSKNFNLPLSYKLKFIKYISWGGIVPFLCFFQPPLFRSSIFILAILYKLYRMLRLFVKI